MAGAMGAVGSAFMNGANLMGVQLVFTLSPASLAFTAIWCATGAFGTPGVRCWQRWKLML